MARAAGLARTVGDEALDDAVLQRMEGDDGEPAARLQRALGRKQRAREFAEFVVDEDAQRLEDARRRMDPVLRIAADSVLDRLGEIARACRTAVSRGASRSCGAMRPACRSSPRKPKMRARSPALKVLTTSAALRPGCAMRMSSGPSWRKEKPRSRLVELHGGDADIEHDAVDRLAGDVRPVWKRRRATSRSRPSDAASMARPAAMASGIPIDRDDRCAASPGSPPYSRRRRTCHRRSVLPCCGRERVQDFGRRTGMCRASPPPASVLPPGPAIIPILPTVPPGQQAGEGRAAAHEPPRHAREAVPAPTSERNDPGRERPLPSAIPVCSRMKSVTVMRPS